MSRMIAILVSLSVMIGLGFLFVKSGTYHDIPSVETPAPDMKDIVFELEGRKIQLKDGLYEKKIPNSATRMRTGLSEWRAQGDLDGDGITDSTAIVVDDPGGSGTFYYVLVALNAKPEPVATNALFLGDRIQITGLHINKGNLEVAIMDRKSGDPMSTSPAVPQTMRVLLKNGQLIPPS